MTRLTKQAGQDLLDLTPAKRCGAGTTLIHQGEPSSHIFLLRSPDRLSTSCVKVIAALENGSESLLGIRVSGDIVGELAALRRAPRSATVTSCNPVLVHAIPHADFMAFLGRHQEAWETVSRMIADRLDWANRRRLDFMGYGVSVRLARVLAELLEQHAIQTPAGLELDVRLSQPELGMFIGAGGDAVGQAMRQLKQAGLVAVHYRRVTVVDVPGLRSFAQLPPSGGS